MRYDAAMPKRSSTERPDFTGNADRVVVEVRGQTRSAPALAQNKNPAAVALGRLGGLKGGKARAVALSKAQRTAIARKAATARWAERQEGRHGAD
jgi:hypothetical protein